MNFNPLKRYVPLAVWTVTLVTILIIPLKIVSYGYLPDDDALRHAAKAVSGKTWQQILVMRSDFTIDPSPGWQAILSWIYQWQKCSAETLVVFSVVALMLLVMSCALPWFRRPEAWLSALLVTSVILPGCPEAFTHGRPYILTDAVFIILLLLWSRPTDDRPRWSVLLSSLFLIAAAAWIHGSWYLLLMPAGAILFAGLWRSAFWYGGCWVAGSFLGASLTGHPWEFLYQSLRHLFEVFGHFTIMRQLVTELYPSDGSALAVLAVAVLLLWRALSCGWNGGVLLNPVFMMAVLGWILGLEVRRFWWDFGMPALIVWMALALQDRLEEHLAFDSGRRLLITLAAAAAVFLSFTSDRGSRWTGNLTAEYYAPDNPDAVHWLPDPGGIIYNTDMTIFFQTFYKNPTAPWRYILGFESGLMRPEDLEVLRKAEWNFDDPRAFEPWVKKMRPQDRFVIRMPNVSSPPNIPELEWHYIGSGLWAGRLPQTTTNLLAMPPPKAAANGVPR
ncbi:MAG: hypothetical protein ACLPRE_02055 [Limisphaerales bacterium]